MRRPTQPALLFRDLDGVERAVRLEQVDRIDEVAREAIIEAGGRRLLASGGALVPLHAGRRLGEEGRVRVLRLHWDGAELGYAVDRVIDIADLAEAFAPAVVAGAIAGVLLHEGRPVELLDVAWLTAQGGAVASGPVAVGRRAAMAA